jgi:hypothetical protein
LEVNNVDPLNDYLPAALFYIGGMDMTSDSEHGRSERKETLSKNLMVKNNSQIDATTARKQQAFWKRILIIDDDPDTTFTGKIDTSLRIFYCKLKNIWMGPLMLSN